MKGSSGTHLPVAGLLEVLEEGGLTLLGLLRRDLLLVLQLLLQLLRHRNVS